MIPIYIVAVAFCSIWALALVYMQLSVRAMPLLRNETSTSSNDDRRWPLLSIIIPACNEADHLESALTTLLEQDYPRLELVVIDDRSTDATGAIIDRLAEGDDRIHPVHIESLPNGWLGKVHAMHRGLHMARGDWFLFTDADVYFRPGALRRSVGYALDHRLDHLACLPEVGNSPPFWLNVAIRSFFFLLCVSARLAEVNKEDSKHAVGIGAFNLVEAETFRRTPGFEWLRMEPADDLGLGLMLKKAGARARFINADGEMSVAWYESLDTMISGLEKNSFGPGASYGLFRQLFIVLLLWGLVTLPPVSLALGVLLDDSILLAAGAIAFACSILTALTMPRKSVTDILAYLLLPAGVLIISVIVLRAAYKCLRNDGIDWRGTHYSLAELRAGQRVRF